MDPILAALDKGPELIAIMRAWYPLIMQWAYEDAERAGVPVTWQPDAADVAQLLDELTARIVGVTDTTRDEIRGILVNAAEAGLGPEAIGRQIRQRGIVASVTRARTIARTETGHAYNRSAVEAYRAGGVTHVRVMDGDEDEPCASANGSIWTVGEAQANPLGHPNCTRAFAPIIEVDQ